MTVHESRKGGLVAGVRVTAEESGVVIHGRVSRNSRHRGGKTHGGRENFLCGFKKRG
jgi:hypothetical protein